MRNILVLLLVLVFFSCRKGTPNEDVVEPISISFKANISGILVNMEEQPISGVLVEVNNQTTTTDDNGVFIFKLVEVSHNEVLVKANKSGYFNGFRKLFIEKNGSGFVRIMLMESIEINIIDNQMGGTAGLSNGTSITFPENAITNIDDSPFLGEFSVSAHYIDPTTIEGQLSMPGDLRAIDGFGETKLLISYGMIVVEIRNIESEILKIGENKQVLLKIRIPDLGMESAPEVIPLWYFDEIKGVWKEEGQAVKEGGYYLGGVKHFSFWNCDNPIDFTKLKLNFNDVQGNGLSDLHIKISNPVIPVSTGHGWTDAAGKVSGWVPVNTSLELEVLNECNEILYEEEIGPFTIESESFYTLENSLVYANISGKLVGCDGLVPVSEGYVMITNNNWYSGALYYADTEGNIAFNYLACDGFSYEEIEIYGVDSENNNISEIQTFVVGNELNMGSILTCPPGENYLHIVNEEGQSYTTNNIGMYIEGDDITGAFVALFLQIDEGDSKLEIILYTHFLGPMVFNNYGYLEIPSIGVTNSSNQNFNINISRFPNLLGEYVIGSGFFTDIETSEEYQISFTVKWEY